MSIYYFAVYISTYKLLTRQIFTYFEWLMVNDGLTNETDQLTKGYTQERCLNIWVIKKENLEKR